MTRDKVADVILTLDAFVPDAAGLFPTCILVRGRGFVRGDRQTYIKPLIEPLSKAGFALFTTNYRLAPQHRWPVLPIGIVLVIVPAEMMQWLLTRSPRGTSALTSSTGEVADCHNPARYRAVGHILPGEAMSRVNGDGKHHFKAEQAVAETRDP